MTALSISSAWDETKALLGRDGRLLGSVALALLVLPQAALGAFAPTRPEEVTATFYLLLIVVLVAGLIGQIAIARLSIPPSSTVGDAMALAARRLLPLLVAFLIISFAAMFLAFLLAFIGVATGMIPVPKPGQPPSLSLGAIVIIPLALVYAVFQLMIPIAANEPGGPLHFIRRSLTLARGNYFKLLLFMALILIVMLLVWLATQLAVGSLVAALFGPPAVGSAPMFLGALVVAIVQAAWAVVSVAMLARIYVQLSNRDTAKGEA